MAVEQPALPAVPAEPIPSTELAPLVSRRERRVLATSAVEVPVVVEPVVVHVPVVVEPVVVDVPVIVEPVGLEPVAEDETSEPAVGIELEIDIVGRGFAEEFGTPEQRAEEIVASVEAETPAPVEPVGAVDHAAVTFAMTSPPEARRRRRAPKRPIFSSARIRAVSLEQLRRPRLSSEKSRALKRGSMSGFIMVLSVGLVASLSLPAIGSSTVSDFAAVQNFSDAGSSQNLSVAGGAALVASRDDYYAQGAPGSLYSTTNTSVSKQAQALAAELMAAVAAGRLKGSTPDHIKEIQWLADGVAEPNCGIDLRILQVMVLAIRNFDTVAVSDVNRRCTGQIEGGGLNSSHYMNGGGHAVDFYELNGKGLYGSDDNTIAFAKILDPLMPKGSDLGQQSCRTYQGIHLNLVNMLEFDDSCTHMHVDVGTASGGLAGNIT